MKKTNALERIEKKSKETLSSVDDFIQKYFGTAKASAGDGAESSSATAPDSSAGNHTSCTLDEVKGEIKKLEGVRDRIRSKNLDSTPESKVMKELLSKAQKQMDTLRKWEKTLSKTDALSPEKVKPMHKFLKDAIGNIKQRVALLENETRSGKGGMNAGGSGKKGITAKLTPSEALAFYKQHLVKLRSLLDLVQSGDGPLPKAETVRHHIRELLKDNIEPETLAQYKFYDLALNPEGGQRSTSKGVRSDSAKQPLTKGDASGKGGSNLPSGLLPSSNGRQKEKLSEGSAWKSPLPVSDKDEGTPAWLDDEADAHNDDTFGESSTVGVAKNTFSDVLRATMAGLPNMSEADRKRVALQKKIPEEDARPSAGKSAEATADLPAANTAPPSTTTAVPKKSEGKGIKEMEVDEDTVGRMLEMSLRNLNHPLDMDRVRVFQPPNPVESIESFPSEILPVLTHRHIYEKFENSTLFFIFYYHQKNAQHLFAVAELQKRGYFYRKSDAAWYRFATKEPNNSNGKTLSNSAGDQPVSVDGRKVDLEQLQYFDFLEKWRWEPADSQTVISTLDFDLPDTKPYDPLH